jgi:hypothetical protein
MSRERSWFTLAGVSKAHALDDIQAALLKDTEECLNQLWPNFQAPPPALNELHLAICLLADWTSRTDRGRARLRKRYLAIIAGMEASLKADNSNLLEHGETFKVVPALLRSVIAADDKEAAAVGSEEIADAVEAWLQSGAD